MQHSCSLKPNGVYIIAEIGMNHNGDVILAEELIDAASRAGADAVKFQTFHTDAFLSSLVANRDERRQFELTDDEWARLAEACRKLSVDFLSTPLDSASLRLLVSLDVRAIKVASGDITNIPLLREIAVTGRTVILSTGCSGLEEVSRALHVIEQAAQSDTDVILLHCVSQYPTQHKDVNLAAIETLKMRFKLPVGISDHTLDVEIVPIAATALGACVIEKHFTLDKNLPGYDHHMSITPDELERLVRYVRATEEAIGSGIKKPSAAEYQRQNAIRRGSILERRLLPRYNSLRRHDASHAPRRRRSR